MKLAAEALLARHLMKHARAEGSMVSSGPTGGGGLGGLLVGLRGRGLGQQVDSWVAPGENHLLAAHELEMLSTPPSSTRPPATRAPTEALC